MLHRDQVYKLRSRGRCSLAVLALSLTAALAGPGVAEAGGALVGQVIVADGGEQKPAGAGVVVYFDSAKDLDDSATELRARAKQRASQVVQKGEQFVPRMTVVPKGSTVAFPNQDRVFHNVFSLSKARRFDLGLFRDGASRTVTFKRAGVVDVYCNIHPKMTARVLVVPNRYYALTDSEGRFTIPKVPAGSYTVVAWNGGETRTEVSMRAGKSTEVRLEVAPPRRRARHQRKDGTPYRRYR